MYKIILLLVFITSFFSCRKQFEGAKNLTIHLSGQVVDSSTNTGIAGVRVKAVWHIGGSGICINCSDTVAATAITNTNGYFDFITTTDSNFFYRNSLDIKAEPGNAYLSFYHYPSIITPANNVSDIRLTFFPKAFLTISSTDTGTDSLTALYLEYNFTSTSFSLNNGLDAFPPASATVETAANMYTQIRWKKVYGFGNTKEFSDSIKCLPNQTNIYTLRY